MVLDGFLEGLKRAGSRFLSILDLRSVSVLWRVL